MSAYINVVKIPLDEKEEYMKIAEAIEAEYERDSMIAAVDQFFTKGCIDQDDQGYWDFNDLLKKKDIHFDHLSVYGNSSVTLNIMRF
jgi:hypothetical protein